MAENSRPFPFLRLAAELRNEIYAISLHHDRSKGDTANTALLRACREIHTEAKELIYEESKFTIHATVQLPVWGEPYNTLELSGDLPTKSFPKVALMNFERYFSTIMRKFKTIDVNIELPGTSDPSFWSEVTCVDDFDSVNVFLYALASFLMKENKVENMTFKISVPDKFDWKISDAELLLYPLAKMPQTTTISVEGFDGAGKLMAHLDTLRASPVCAETLRFSIIEESKLVLAAYLRRHKDDDKTKEVAPYYEALQRCIDAPFLNFWLGNENNIMADFEMLRGVLEGRPAKGESSEEREFREDLLSFYSQP